MNIFIDQNSQIGAETFDVHPNQYSDLQFNVLEGSWDCPVCESDNYLMDLNTAELERTIQMQKINPRLK
jgi:hypothetical protein